MSRRLDIDVVNIDIFLRRTYFKRYKVFLLINLAYLASRYTFIHVYSHPYLSIRFRGLLNKIEGAITRIIVFVIIPIPLGLLDR